MTNVIELSDSEIDTIIASLRFWQSHRAYDESVMKHLGFDSIWKIAAEHGYPIGLREIDELIHSINTGGRDR